MEIWGPRVLLRNIFFPERYTQFEDSVNEQNAVPSPQFYSLLRFLSTSKWSFLKVIILTWKIYSSIFCLYFFCSEMWFLLFFHYFFCRLYSLIWRFWMNMVGLAGLYGGLLVVYLLVDRRQTWTLEVDVGIY